MAARLTAGIDEAGRGPVFGPLVVACAVTDDPAGLRALGVRDSKELSPARREALERALKGRLCAYGVVALEPAEVDRAVERHDLNGAEATAFARAAGRAAASAKLTRFDELQADAAGADAPRFGSALLGQLKLHAASLKVGALVAEHKADQRFPAVGAASILAKVERDRQVRKLAESVGREIGSGYTSDPTTIAFLREYITAEGDLPPFARRSWKTSRRMMSEAGAATPPLAAFDPGDEVDG